MAKDNKEAEPQKEPPVNPNPEPPKEAPTPPRAFRVVWSGITNAAGQLSLKDEVLTAEEVGDFALHLERGAIVEVTAEESK